MNTYNKQQGHTGRANTITTDAAKLKVTFLGGLADVGEKNMAVIEYGSDALILDCGINLGINLPGINYEINDTSYLATIKHKIKGYVITHGHLDHVIPLVSCKRLLKTSRACRSHVRPVLYL
jgi:mRNA degradation ribonuclease J1/J2